MQPPKSDRVHGDRDLREPDRDHSLTCFSRTRMTLIQTRSTVKRSRLALAVFLVFAPAASPQRASPRADARPLVLTGAIPLPNAQGRIDHLGSDFKGRLF